MSWRCPVCGTYNDPSETQCRICGAYSPSAPTLPQGDYTHWDQHSKRRVVIRIEETPIRELVGATFTVEVPQTGSVITLGRATDNAIIIPDPTVSRRHARIVVSSNTAILEDLGSRNGTYIIKGKEAVRISMIDINGGALVKLGSSTVIRIIMER